MYPDEEKYQGWDWTLFHLSFLQKEKEKAEKEKAAMDAIFKPVAQVQKISAGADPKSVLCLFFKQGHCTKGDKCKFSHDLSLENKAEKRSIYVDSRDVDLEEGEGVAVCM